MSTILRRLQKLVRDPGLIISRLYARRLARDQKLAYEMSANGEKELLFRIRAVTPKVVLDVGANVGDWAQLALDAFPESTVHCFEISETTQATLERRMVGKPVIVNRFGLSDRNATIQFKEYGANSVVNTTVIRNSFHDSSLQPTLRTARVVTGADYSKMNDLTAIDVLKIDVEGAEHMVLAGFGSLLFEGRIRLIQFEYGYANGDTKFLMRDFYEMLGANGYIIARVQPMPLRFRPWEYRDNNFESGPNYVAIRSVDVELRSLLEAA